MSANRANERLRETGYAFGTNVGAFRGPAVMQYIGEAGYDFVTIDMEHSSFDWSTVSALVQAARAYGMTPVVRLERPTRETVGRALDLGALGLMFHDVNRPAEVEQIVEWVGSSKFAGRTGSADDARSEFTVVVQIESREAIDSLDEILSAGPVDVASVGRGDLTQSLGHGDDRLHPDVVAAVETIVAACRRHGVHPGMASVSRMDQEEVDELVRQGFAWLTFGTDKHILRQAYRRGVRMMRQAADLRA